MVDPLGVDDAAIEGSKVWEFLMVTPSLNMSLCQDVTELGRVAELRHHLSMAARSAGVELSDEEVARCSEGKHRLMKLALFAGGTRA